MYVRFERWRIGANVHYIRFAGGVEKVKLKKLQPALWSVVGDEAEPDPAPGADAEPEPEPEPAAAEEAEPPELDAWLAQADLAQYAVQVKEYGYHTLKVLQAATEADIVEMTEDADVKMKKPHRRIFVAEWKKLLAAAAGGAGDGDAPAAAPVQVVLLPKYVAAEKLLRQVLAE